MHSCAGATWNKIKIARRRERELVVNNNVDNAFQLPISSIIPTFPSPSVNSRFVVPTGGSYGALMPLLVSQQLPSTGMENPLHGAALPRMDRVGWAKKRSKVVPRFGEAKCKVCSLARQSDSTSCGQSGRIKGDVVGDPYAMRSQMEREVVRGGTETSMNQEPRYVRKWKECVSEDDGKQSKEGEPRLTTQ
ncbi:hypothetical protein CPB84DRAFT_1744516 [Gymnopilus junonius]|uniref:Uncharacterized protein n=1 Tax=Gymnopilus junonius TaxID=109634 RepID=A0A9P5NUU8_GYMJU|nr:hypothetical protein CPB84DRAFT_1744516 [Gymnopilus junonius]